MSNVEERGRDAVVAHDEMWNEVLFAAFAEYNRSGESLHMVHPPYL